MAYVIDKSRPTTFYIFEYVFNVRYPELQSRSVDHIKHFGTPSTGNKDIDRNINSQLVNSWITIAKMVEYHEANCPLIFPNQEDIKMIYECISNHLYLWKKELENGINLGDAPILDLIALDKFANGVYAHAKYQFTPQIAESLLVQHMNGISRVNKRNFFKTKPKEVQVDKDGSVNIEHDPYPKREELTDMFRERMVSKPGHWRGRDGN